MKRKGESDLEFMLRVSKEGSVATSVDVLVSKAMDIKIENERLRAALARVERTLQPIDDSEHVETAGRAREIAIAALNIRPGVAR